MGTRREERSGDPTQYRWITLGGTYNVSVWAPVWVSGSLDRAETTEYGPGDPSQSDGFTPSDVIGNLKFSGRGQTSFQFDPPAKLQATPPDTSGGFKIAWWKGKANVWVVLPPTSSTDPNQIAVEIASIGDPPISWGK